MKNWQRLLVVALWGLPVVVSAEVRVNGFLNAVGGFASERNNGRYEAEELQFEPDSSFGLQVSSDVAEKTTVTGQLIARGIANFQVEASWAYMTYHISDALQFRAGRFRTPFFLYSDHLDVGYAQHWLAPPNEVYALQFDSINGVDLNYNLPLGPFDVKLQLYAGSANDDFINAKTGETLELQLREQVGVIGTLGYQWLTLRTSFHRVADLTIQNFSELALPQPLGNVAGLKAAIIALDQQVDLAGNGQYIIDNLDVAGAAAEFAEAAIELDWAHFFVIAEGTLLTFDRGPLAEQRRHFISAGARAGSVTYYATYARANDQQVRLADRLPVIAGFTEGLRGALDGLTSSVTLQSETASLGLRYDFTPGAAFKVEVSENQMPTIEDSHLVRFGYNLIF